MADVTNILTFDVEEWFQVYNLWEAIPRSEWEGCPSRLENQVAKLLDILDRRNCRATFFVLGWVARHRPGVVKEIARRGDEIACHGLNHDLVTDMTPERFRRETAAATELLEDLTGVKVRGYRASNFSIQRGNLWALEVLAELGFAYDSSVYPVVRGRYGIPGFPRGPVRLILPSGATLLEFPPPTMRFLGATVPVAGGGYFRFFPYRVTRGALTRLNRAGAPAVVYLHPWEIDPGQPRVKGGGILKRWMHYCNLSRTEGRLERLLEDFRFGSVEEALEGMTGEPPDFRVE